MTFLRHSTLAIRRLAVQAKSNIRRSYTQLTTPALKVAQAESGVRRSSKKFGEGLALPLAFVILGLSFSGFSTHQIMTCRDSRLDHTANTLKK